MTNVKTATRVPGPARRHQEKKRFKTEAERTSPDLIDHMSGLKICDKSMTDMLDHLCLDISHPTHVLTQVLVEFSYVLFQTFKTTS